jgi:hypothetical protein
MMIQVKAADYRAGFLMPGNPSLPNSEKMYGHTLGFIP